MFTLYDNDLKKVVVIKKINDDSIEIKNISTYEEYQGKGYGRKMIKYIEDYYKNRFKELYLGRGESPLTIEDSKLYFDLSTPVPEHKAPDPTPPSFKNPRKQ